jgi:integrase
MFPTHLFDDPYVVITWAWCLGHTSPHPVNTLVNGRPVALGRNEIAIKFPADQCLGLTESQLSGSLTKLAQLKFLSVERLADHFRVKFLLPVMPRGGHVSTNGVATESDHPQITFAEFASQYLEYVKEYQAPKSHLNAKRVMKFAVREFGPILLSALTPMHLEDYRRRRMQEKKISATTMNIDTRSLKPCLEYAMRRGYLQINPFRSFKEIRQPRKLPLTFKDEEVSNLLAVVAEDLKLVISTAYLTGMRRGEIVFLQWNDIDFDERTIRVEASKEYRVKMGGARIIPLNNAMENLLKRLPRHDPRVFMRAEGAPWPEGLVTKNFKKAVRLLELDDQMHFHHLRHTFASNLARKGVPMPVIQSLLGHRHLRTTEGYTRIPTSAMSEALETLTLPPK